MDSVKQSNGLQDVSARALAIARQIDQLAPGSYYIHVEKVADRAAQWAVKIVGEVLVRELKVYIPKDEKAE